MRAGDGAAEGDVAISAGGGWKQRRIESPAGSGQHEEQVEARRQKCFDRLGLAIEEPESSQGCDDADRNDERSREVEVIVQAGWTHNNGGGETDQR